MLCPNWGFRDCRLNLGRFATDMSDADVMGRSARFLAGLGVGGKGGGGMGSAAYFGGMVGLMQ